MLKVHVVFFLFVCLFYVKDNFKIDVVGNFKATLWWSLLGAQKAPNPRNDPSWCSWNVSERLWVTNRGWSGRDRPILLSDSCRKRIMIKYFWRKSFTFMVDGRYLKVLHVAYVTFLIVLTNSSVTWKRFSVCSLFHWPFRLILRNKQEPKNIKKKKCTVRRIFQTY